MLLKSVIFVVLSLLCQSAVGKTRNDPVVQTKLGQIRGVHAEDGDYSMFMGIPFGQVDKTNPFGAASPYPKFEEEFEANDDSVVCPQIDEFSFEAIGTLDCLHVNVYVPKTASSSNQLAVLVWIYGGRFAFGMAGRNIYGPKFFLKNDIILVTLNYRLGPYGFMCVDTPDIPGNQAFKDQLLALRWIKNNIESFGGDANRITIFGESAGSMSADVHLYSEHEQLFNGVIMQSGTSSMFGIGEGNLKAPIDLAKQLGFITEDLNEAISFLTNSDPIVVISAVAAFQFLPCIEKKFENVESFITDYFINKNIPKVKNTTVLIGFNSNEWIAGYILSSPESIAASNPFYENIKNLFNFDEKLLLELEYLVRRFYMGDQEINENNIYSIADFSSDTMINHPVVRAIDKYLENEAEKVFYYMFSYNGKRNFVQRNYNFTIEGAAHADEIGYLFDVSFWPEEPTPEDQLIIDRLTALWANFAKYGDPTPATSTLLPVKWEPITKNSPYYYYNIDSTLALGTRPFNQRMAFWDLLYRTHYQYEKGFGENHASVSVPLSSLLLFYILTFIHSCI